MRLASIAVATLTLLAATSADASCIRFSCFCLNNEMPRSTTGTLEASIQTVDGPRTRFVVEMVRGNGSAMQVADLVTLPREDGDVASGRWLLFFADGNFQSRMPIAANATVSCQYATSAFVVTAEHATDLFARSDCQDAVEAEGLSYPCNDVVRSCAAGGLDGSTLLLAAAWFSLRRRRRFTRP